MSGEGQGNEQKVKMKRMVTRRANAPRLIKRTALISSALLLMIVALWIIGGLHPPQSKESPPALKEPAQPPRTEKDTPPPSVKVSEETKERKEIKETKETEMIKSGGLESEVRESLEKKELGNTTKRPDFVLDGIIWSTEPGRRLASINDRYLKEGDVVNGVTVVRIDKTEVTLQLNEDKWTIHLKK